MPTIKQLSQSLVNKIAAGEVIERPASVVKELLENSVDAGATSIELTIEGGGIDLIRISDNGCGIEQEQIPLAFASHATSKLVEAEDLFDVRTLGFRGEALASIAEISHMTMRTRVAESDSGYEVAMRGGEATPIQPTGCPVGTTFEVRHLFFNTPVRRKFLKTPQTEAGHITEAFTRIALAYPHVQMSMASGTRSVFDLPATDSWKERIRAFFGDEVSDSLIAVESESEEAQLIGYVADPSVSRSNNRMQYLFLNRRHIKDRSLQHALGEAYRGLLMVGRFPVCFLRLTLPPSSVDVNVHPTKMEVRFQESGKLYSQLLRTLRHEFLTSDLTARARHVPGPAPAGLKATDSPQPAPQEQGESRWEAHAEKMSTVSPKLDLPHSVPEFKPFPGDQSQGLSASAIAASQGIAASQSNAAIGSWNAPGHPAHELGSQDSPPLGTHVRVDSVTPTLPTDVAPDASMELPSSPETPTHSHLGFQVHQRYLVTQDESGMVVVDQHALHERILYEQLRKKADSKSLEVQKLLVPEPLDLTPSEAAAALDSKDLLAEIGIEIEPFGGDTILMTSYPAILARMRPAEVMRQVLEPLMSGGKEPSTREVMDEILHMLACKAAIKAGDRLAEEEVTALLEQRDHFQNTHHCPHGRPTALFFSREQLDKMFGRT